MFGDSPSHAPVAASGPAAVDGVDRSQVDLLFRQADQNQDGRQVLASSKLYLAISCQNHHALTSLACML